MSRKKLRLELRTRNFLEIQPTVIPLLRRYKKRWRVERLFAWFHNFRRLVTRWEYHVENFLGMVHLACLKLLLKHL